MLFRLSSATNWLGRLAELGCSVSSKLFLFYSFEDCKPFLLPMKFLTRNMHLLTKPFLPPPLPLLTPALVEIGALRLDDATDDGSSNSKLLDDVDDDDADALETCRVSDFALDKSDFVLVGDSSKTNDVTDSVPSANRLILLRPVRRASGSRLRARSNMSRIFGTKPMPPGRFRPADRGSVATLLLKSMTAPAGLISRTTFSSASSSSGTRLLSLSGRP
jgi:hypothetical protein